MKLALIAVIAAAGLLTACASNQSCKADASYRKAAAVPPIKAADGLNLPQSPSALKVPDLTPAALAAASDPLPKKGKGTACLDYPPDLPPSDAAAIEPTKR